MRLDGYIRVSRVAGREGESFISPTLQRERCKAIAKAGGHRIIRWHEDLDQPGSRSERAGFQAALSRVEKGTTEGIVVARLDRFARSVVDAANALRRIRDANGALISAQESLDTSTAFGRFAMHMMLAMAELELERIRENWDAARAAAVARGVHVASRTPTGYGRDDAKRLTPNDDAPAIAEAFRRKAAGASWGELARVLQEAEVLTPYGGINWTARSLSHLISNRAYIGEARSGEHVLADAHDSLIDAGTWQKAQRRGGRSTPPKGGALLSGLLRCAGCRYALKADKMKDRSGEKVRLYACRGKRASGTCQNRSAVLGSVIEPWIVEQFLQRVGDITAQASRRTAAVDRAEQKVANTEAELDAYIAAGLAEVVGVERFRAGATQRQSAVDEAQLALAETRAAAGELDLPDQAELRKVWPTLDTRQQRQLLSVAIDAIFLRRVGQVNVPVPERAIILWRGEAPANLPGVGQRNVALRSFDFPARARV